MILGTYKGGGVTVPISLIHDQGQGKKGGGDDDKKFPSIMTAEGTDKGGVVPVSTSLVHEPRGVYDHAFSPQASSPLPTRSVILPKSSIKKPTTQEQIPIDESALNRLRYCEARTPQYNARPSNLTQSESFISITFHHDDDDEYSPAVSIRSRFEKIILLWQTLDPEVAVNGAWTQNVPSAPLLKGGTLPEKWISLQSYLYINNPQSLGSGYVKDGVKQPQGPTYATARITTTLDTTHLLATLAMDLSQMNVRMYVKSLSVLSSKAIVAIIGTHVEWNLPSMTIELRQEIGEMVDKRQAEGYWEKYPEFHNRASPLFILKSQKMKAPKPVEGSTPQERHFEEFYHNLRQIIVIECPDEDQGWLLEVFEVARTDGLIKTLVSRCATIIVLPSNSTTSSENEHFAKSLKRHMVLLATNSINTIVDVASMNAPVRVETEPGHDPPYKTTSLKRELLSFRLGDTVDGKEGAKFIDGAQFVIAGNGQGGGKVLVMHSNKEEVVTMISNFSSNPVAYMYGYLRRVKHFTERCANKCNTTWFSYPLRMTDSSFHPTTHIMTSRLRSAYTMLEKDMKDLGCLEIPEHIRNEIDVRMKSKEEEASLQKLTEMFNIQSDQPATDFSCINSAASALTTTSHTTTGNQSLRSVTTEMVNRQLDSKREERCCLMMRLRELDPTHKIFQEPGYNEDMEYLSDDSVNEVDQAILYRATRGQITRLNNLINQVEKGLIEVEEPQVGTRENSDIMTDEDQDPTEKGSMEVDGAQDEAVGNIVFTPEESQELARLNKEIAQLEKGAQDDPFMRFFDPNSDEYKSLPRSNNGSNEYPTNYEAQVLSARKTCDTIVPAADVAPTGPMFTTQDGIIRNVRVIPGGFGRPRDGSCPMQARPPRLVLPVYPWNYEAIMDPSIVNVTEEEIARARASVALAEAEREENRRGSDSNVEEAHASAASAEAQNGTPPPLRGSTNPSGPVARSSKADSLDGVVQGS
jgi:hypothetical protein